MGKIDQVTELLKQSLNSTETKGDSDGSKPDSEAGPGTDDGILTEQEGADTTEGGDGDSSGDTALAEGDEAEEPEEIKAIRAALDEEREGVNNQAISNMNERRQIDAIIEMLGDKVPPEVSEQFKQLNDAYLAREIQSLKRVLPKWHDAKTAEYESGLIMGMAAKYGVTRPELESMVTDHRLVKLLRDAALTQDWKAKHQTKAARSATRRPQGAQDAIKRAMSPSANKQDKLAAIAVLIT